MQARDVALLRGLTSAAGRPLNDKLVRLISYDEQAGRWVVKVRCDAPAIEQQQIRVKSDNLMPFGQECVKQVLITPRGEIVDQIEMSFVQLRDDMLRCTADIPRAEMRRQLEMGIYLTFEGSSSLAYSSSAPDENYAYAR